MLNLKEITSKCFAFKPDGECDVFGEKAETCDCSCPFYKPIGCEDWIRKEDGDEIWIIPPEEMTWKTKDGSIILVPIGEFYAQVAEKN